jgi:hypothetical protein
MEAGLDCQSRAIVSIPNDGAAGLRKRRGGAPRAGFVVEQWGRRRNGMFEAVDAGAQASTLVEFRSLIDSVRRSGSSETSASRRFARRATPHRSAIDGDR